MSQKIFLVPTDFTSVSECALNHAVMLAKTTDAKIILVHVVSSQEKLPKGRKRLAKAKQQAFDKYGTEVETVVRVGSIYEDIGDLAEEIEATLVVIGTHGLKGVQFITGGRTLKIVTSANTPFIVVQEKGIGENGYDDIVVPLDLKKETKQKLSLVADMAKYFNSKIHLIVPEEDDEFLKNKISRNLNYAETFFAGMDIPFTSRVATGEKDFDDEIIEFAEEINADLISLMNIPSISLTNLFGGHYVQNLVTNKPEIAVMLMNPKEVSHASIFGAYSGRG